MPGTRRLARRPRPSAAMTPPISPRPGPHENMTFVASRLDHALVQPCDGVERRQDGSLLPRRNVGSVLARQHDPAVDLAEIVVMLRPCLVGPVAGAAQGKGHA